MSIIRDRDIREPLFDFLEENFGKVRIIEEKTIGKSRADVLMVCEDALFGIEIKSDADTYGRLARQVKDYNKVFDYNVVVVGTRHAHHVAEHVPESWGIITVEQAGENTLDFYILRQPQKNAKRKMQNKLSLLWRKELQHILLAHGLPKYTSKNKKFIREKLVANVPEEELDRLISEELFERDYTVYEED